MGMPISKAGDTSLGHVFSPSPITPTTTNVTAMGSPVHVVGDPIAVHGLGNSAHAGTIGLGSTTVLVGNKGVARLMDTGDCGAMVSGSGGSILVGG